MVRGPFAEFEGKKIPLDLAYNRILDCFDILREEQLDEYDRIDITLSLLTKDCRSVARMCPEQKIKLYKQIVGEHINLNKRSSPGRATERLFDFRRDFDLIFASFQTAYGLDLIELKDQLSWWKFFCLFQGLPEQTKMREVMAIRGRKLPPLNSQNQEEVRQLQELKAYWRLPPEWGAENYEDQLNQMFSTLKNMADRR